MLQQYEKRNARNEKDDDQLQEVFATLTEKQQDDIMQMDPDSAIAELRNVVRNTRSEDSAYYKLISGRSSGRGRPMGREGGRREGGADRGRDDRPPGGGGRPPGQGSGGPRSRPDIDTKNAPGRPGGGNQRGGGR